MSCEYVVVRSAANLPQTATQNLFTVSGGRVLLLGMVGEVTTAIQAQANTATVYVGASQTLVPWSDDLNGLAVGKALGVATGSPTDASGHHNADAVFPFPPVPVVVMSGADIQLQCAASSTGQIAWTLWYEPLDPGAQVTAV